MSQSPGLSGTLAFAYHPGMCLLALPVIFQEMNSLSLLVCSFCHIFITLLHQLQTSLKNQWKKRQYAMTIHPHPIITCVRLWSIHNPTCNPSPKKKKPIPHTRFIFSPQDLIFKTHPWAFAWNRSPQCRQNPTWYILCTACNLCSKFPNYQNKSDKSVSNSLHPASILW